MITEALAMVALLAEAPEGGAGFAPWARMIPLLVIMVAMMYLLIWRPESQRRKKHEQLLNALKPKDKVLTAGGVMGEVIEVKATKFVVEIDKRKGVRVEVARRYVVDKLAEEEGESRSATEAGEAKK